MRRFIVGFFAVIGGAVSLFIVVVAGLLIWGTSSPAPVGDSTVLSLNLNQALTDGPPDALAGLLGEAQPTLRDVLDALERAGGDARVKGILARMGGDGMATAQVQELRDAIAVFRAKGKFAVVVPRPGPTVLMLMSINWWIVRVPT